jgi:hypothetical protein
MHEALGLISSTAERQKGRKEGRRAERKKF